MPTRSDASPDTGEPHGTATSAGSGDTAAIVAELRDDRRRLLTEGPPPGRAWCAVATVAVDRALIGLAAPVLGRRRLTVAAVGGYGRAELCPRSDVDVLLVHDRLGAAELEDAVRAIVYPLWDVGLTVGYAVRDAREAVAACDDPVTGSAMLDLRVVAGDHDLGHQVRRGAVQRLVRRGRRFVEALAEADAERRTRAGDAAEVLEPNLKDGAGGLRDVQSLRWAAAALVGTGGLDPLVSAGYLAAPDRARLAASYDRLLAARVALHLVATAREEAGKVETLRFDLQDDVAARCGFVDGATTHDLAAHRLLTGLYLATRTVDHVGRQAWALIGADLARGRRRRRRPTERLVDGFELVDGVLRLPTPAATRPSTPRPPVPARSAASRRSAGTSRASTGRAATTPAPDRAVHGSAVAASSAAPASVAARRGGVRVEAVDPELPTRLLRALATTGAVLDRRSAAQLRQLAERCAAPDAPPWTWTDEARARLCEVLWLGRAAMPALAELDDTGLLTAIIPEWAALRGRPQRNPYHRYALDRHAWHAAAALADLVRTESWAAEAAGRVGDREGLILGALLHDVGKAHGEPHSVTGVPVARAVAERLGAAPPSVDLVERMVSLHLVLPDTARTRDLTDRALVSDVTTRIGDHATLWALRLLAEADGRATGPTAWTDWTAQLVTTLTTKVANVIDEHDPSTPEVETLDPAEATARAAVALAAELGADPDDVRDHLARCSERYAEAVSPRAVVRHTLMARTRPGPTEVRTRVTPGDLVADLDDDEADQMLAAVRCLDELDVVALDHPGWFAKVAGVVALHGGSIVAADAFTRDDGLAVDTFRVERPEGLGGSWWARVEGDLAEAAAGRLAVRARVAHMVRVERRRLARRPEVETSVVAELDPTGTVTIVEVRTQDRLGVLYAIATALAELELDIVVARVQTLGREVVDVFYVRDAEGNALDRDLVDELVLAVTSSLEEH